MVETAWSFVAHASCRASYCCFMIITFFIWFPTSVAAAFASFSISLLRTEFSCKTLFSLMLASITFFCCKSDFTPSISIQSAGMPNIFASLSRWDIANTILSSSVENCASNSRSITLENSWVLRILTFSAFSDCKNKFDKSDSGETPNAALVSLFWQLSPLRVSGARKRVSCWSEKISSFALVASSNATWFSIHFSAHLLPVSSSLAWACSTLQRSSASSILITVSWKACCSCKSSFCLLASATCSSTASTAILSLSSCISDAFRTHSSQIPSHLLPVSSTLTCSTRHLSSASARSFAKADSLRTSCSACGCACCCISNSSSSWRILIVWRSLDLTRSSAPVCNISASRAFSASKLHLCSLAIISPCTGDPMSDRVVPNSAIAKSRLKVWTESAQQAAKRPVFQSQLQAQLGEPYGCAARGHVWHILTYLGEPSGCRFQRTQKVLSSPSRTHIFFLFRGSCFPSHEGNGCWHQYPFRERKECRRGGAACCFAHIHLRKDEVFDSPYEFQNV